MGYANAVSGNDDRLNKEIVSLDRIGTMSRGTSDDDGKDDGREEHLFAIELGSDCHRPGFKKHLFCSLCDRTIVLRFIVFPS